MTALDIVPVQAQVRCYPRDPAGSLIGVFPGIALTFSHGKGSDGSQLSFQISQGDPDNTYNPSAFDDALAHVELDKGDGFFPHGTMYVLQDGGELLVDGARTRQITGAPALYAFAQEWLVLHDQGIINRRGPTEVFFGWQHPIFDVDVSIAAGHDWRDVTHAPRSDFTGSAPRADQPPGWECDAADWIHRPVDSGDTAYPGHLNLIRIGSFEVVGTAKKIRIASSADEEHKVYLFGPGQGGVIIDSTEQETGYTVNNRWNEVLRPGTYFVAAEMTTVWTKGGDGIDALGLYVGPVNTHNAVTTFYLHTGMDGIQILRMDKALPRPGLTLGQMLNLLMDQFEVWCPEGSSSTLTRTWSDTQDSDGADWTQDHERSWSVGTDIAQVIADFEDDYDLDLNAVREMQAWAQKGADLSATIKIKPGTGSAAADENATSYDPEVVRPTATRALIYTPDGFTTSVFSTIEGTTQPRAIYVESQQAVSMGQARVLAHHVISEQDHPFSTDTAKVVPLADQIPMIDFEWGDIVQGMDRVRAPRNVHVVAVAAGRDTDDGPLTFELEMAQYALMTPDDEAANDSLMWIEEPPGGVGPGDPEGDGDSGYDDTGSGGGVFVPSDSFAFTVQVGGNDQRGLSKAALYTAVAGALGRDLGGRLKFFGGGGGDLNDSWSNRTATGSSEPLPLLCFKSLVSADVDAFAVAHGAVPQVWVWFQEFYSTSPSAWTTHNNQWHTIKTRRDASSHAANIELQAVSSMSQYRSNPGHFTDIDASNLDSWGADSYNAISGGYPNDVIFGSQRDAWAVLKARDNPDLKWRVSEWGVSRYKKVGGSLVLMTGTERIAIAQRQLDYAIANGMSSLTYWAVDNSDQAPIKDWSIDKGTSADNEFAAWVADAMDTYPL